MPETNIQNPHLIRHLKGNPGNKIIIIGGIHGNEESGVTAIENILPEVEKHYLPERGSIYFLKGNIAALEKGERFIDKDINRLWTNEIIQRKHMKYRDEMELRSLHRLITKDICNGEYQNCTFLDLHTFSAKSGLFCIPADTPQSIETAKSFGVPFIERLASGLSGTTLGYFGDKGMDAVVFEGGTHHTAQSVKNIEHAIWHLLAWKGVVPEDLYQVVNSRQKLIEVSDDYPHHLELVYHHTLVDYRHFQMKKGYYNFKPVKKAEPLAIQDDHDVLCPANGYILMPLYQKKGSDGFFIVSDKE